MKKKINILTGRIHARIGKRGKRMNKKEYIKSRIEYYREENKGIKLNKAMAKQCAEEDVHVRVKASNCPGERGTGDM